MFIKQTLLVVMLTAASLVAESAPKSAWALPAAHLPHHPHEQAAEILRLIRTHAPSPEVAERFIAIASCEVNEFTHRLRDGTLVQNGQIVRNGQVIQQHRSDGGFGVLQIMPAHIRTARRHGLDIVDNVEDYIRYAFMLYHERRARRQTGFEDWYPSRRCWARGGRVTEWLTVLEQYHFIEIAQVP